MKTIIAGSRSIADIDIIVSAIESSGITITEVVSGAARGVDRLGEQWAKDNGIPIKQIKPNWALGRGAGMANNKIMVEYAEAAIIIWDGKSKGTKNTIDLCHKMGLKVVVTSIISQRRILRANLDLK